MPSQNMLDCLLKISFTYGSMVVFLFGAEIQIDIFQHDRCSLEIRSVRLRVCIIYKFPLCPVIHASYHCIFDNRQFDKMHLLYVCYWIVYADTK